MEKTNNFKSIIEESNEKLAEYCERKVVDMKRNSVLFEDMEGKKITNKQLRDTLVEKGYCNIGGLVTHENHAKVTKSIKKLTNTADVAMHLNNGELDWELVKVYTSNYDNPYKEIHYYETQPLVSKQRKANFSSDTEEVFSVLRRELFLLFNPLIQKLDTLIDTNTGNMLTIRQVELLNMYGDSVVREVTMIIEQSINQTNPLEPEYEEFADLVKTNTANLIDELINEDVYLEVSKINKIYNDAWSSPHQEYHDRVENMNKYFRDMGIFKEKIWDRALKQNITYTEEFKQIINYWGH